MIHANNAADRASRMGLGVVEGGPVTPLVLIVGPKIHLIRVGVWVERINLLVVVVLAVNERPEKTSWFRAEDFLQELRFQIVLHFVTSGILTVLQKPSVAAAGSRSASFLDFIVGGIGKAQDQPLEFFAEFIFLGQILQAFALCFRGRIENEVAFADEHRAGYFSVHRRDKANGARIQMKSARVALQTEIHDTDSFTPQRDVAQSDVVGIRVWTRLGASDTQSDKRCRQEQSSDKLERGRERRRDSGPWRSLRRGNNKRTAEKQNTLTLDSHVELLRNGCREFRACIA